MFTSELREVALVCDRAAVLHGGRIVAELPADAGENALLTAAHGLDVETVAMTSVDVRSRPTARRSTGRRSTTSCRDAVTTPAARRSRPPRRAGRSASPCCSSCSLVWRFSQLPDVRRLRDPHDHRRHDVAGLPGDGPERDRHLRRHRPVGRGEDGVRQLPVGDVDGGPGPSPPASLLAVAVRR